MLFPIKEFMNGDACGISVEWNPKSFQPKSSMVNRTMCGWLPESVFDWWVDLCSFMFVSEAVFEELCDFKVAAVPSNPSAKIIA